MTTVSGETVLAGRYRVGPLLGRGGMAEVRDGHDERLARPVAVKLLRPDMAARSDVRTRFEAEARAAARLSHPNVVAVFDTGEHGGVPFIVMERLPGDTLAHRLASGPVDLDWLRRLAGDVLGALGAAHRAGLVHRDVKPGNILIGADGCAKVADFGIAKSLEEAGAADLTGTNQLIGTPAYLAPERLDGRPATARSDLYALGVVLYESLAGRKPFQGDTAVAVAYAVRRGSPRPLAEVRPDLPPDLVAVVERAMHHDPERRFATADDMAAALGVAGAAGDGAAAGVAVLPAGEDDRTIDAASITALSSRGPAGVAAATVAGDSPTEVLPVAPPPAGAPAAALPADDPSPADPVVAVWDGRRETRHRGARPAWLAGPGDLLLAGRRPLLAGAAVLVVALLLVAAWDGDGERGAIARRLRSEAAALDARDGPRAEEAAERLEKVAQAVVAGGGSDAAGALLADVAGWRAAGELSEEAAAVTDALLDVPGVVPPAPSTTTSEVTVPTTTGPPHDDGNGDDGRGDDGKGDDGKKKGKGRD